MVISGSDANLIIDSFYLTSDIPVNVHFFSGGGIESKNKDGVTCFNLFDFDTTGGSMIVAFDPTQSLSRPNIQYVMNIHCKSGWNVFLDRLPRPWMLVIIIVVAIIIGIVGILFAIYFIRFYWKRWCGPRPLPPQQLQSVSSGTSIVQQQQSSQQIIHNHIDNSNTIQHINSHNNATTSPTSSQPPVVYQPLASPSIHFAPVINANSSNTSNPVTTIEHQQPISMDGVRVHLPVHEDEDDSVDLR